MAMTGDDEQRVIDAHAEADHHAQDQGELRDVHDGGQDADAGGADEDAEQRRHDGKPHGDDRAEGDEEHDDRDPDPDQLAARVFLREEGERAGQLDLDTCGAGAFDNRHGVLELGSGQLVDRVGDVDVGGPPVGAEGRRLRRKRIGHAGHVVARGESRSGFFDRRGVADVVEAAVVGVKHDAGGLAALAREPVIEDISRVLGLDSRHSEAVVELTPGASLERHDGDRSHEPEAQDPERVLGAAVAEAEQECAHGILLELGPAACGTPAPSRCVLI